MDHIGHNGQLCDLQYNSYVAVIKFILLILEHLRNRIVSDVEQSLCWASMADKTTNIAAMCCPSHLPQPGQNKDFQICAMLKPCNETCCLMQL